MFAVQCSFCQHENVPGARFCAECGSPLHLRVCPNAQCGKVSDVNAVRCEFCGTPFPRIALAEPGALDAPSAAAPDLQAPAGDDADPDAAQKPAASPWPLIAVAIVAGGLPLLWFNRAALPTPKTWQTTPEVERLIAPPVLPPPAAVPAAAPAAPAAAAAQPPAAQGTESLTLPPISAPIQPAAADKAEPAETDAGGQPKTLEAKTVPQEKPKAKRETGDRKSKSAEPADATRPCTEAAAALGLCTAKQAGK